MIAGVEILDGQVLAQLLEVPAQLVLEKHPDVVLEQVARGIFLRLGPGEQGLSSPFGHHNHRVTGLGQLALQRLAQSVLPLQGEIDFGH